MEGLGFSSLIKRYEFIKTLSRILSRREDPPHCIGASEPPPSAQQQETT